MSNFLIRPLFIALFLVVAGTVTVSAQPKSKIEHYSTEDGLSHDIITCMFKDSEGFMWFGTWDGINRFDGHHFLSFKSSPGDMSQLKNDRIEQITEDQANHLWIRAYDGHIYRFDKSSQQFLPLASILQFKNHLQITFNRIIASEGNMLWLSVENKGLIWVPDTRVNSTTYYAYHTGGKGSFRLPANQVNFLKKDQDGKIWLGTPSGLVYLHKDAKGIFQSHIVKSDSFGHLNFLAITESGNKLYFATKQGQLVIYDKPGRSFSVVSVSNGSLNALQLDNNKQALYITTSSGQLVTLNTATLSFSSSVYNTGVPLYSIYKDRGGSLWIEPDKQGVIRYNTADRKFSTYYQKNDSKNNYGGSHFKVFEDNKGQIWTILKDGGFGYYDKAKDSLAYFYNKPGSQNRLFSNIVNVAYYDPDGILWLYTDQRGVEKIIFQPNGFRQQLLIDPWMFKSDNEVRGLLCDRRNRLWMGAKSGRLYVYDHDQPVNITFENLPKDGMGSVYTMMQDSKGAIWLGTKASGLYRAEPLNAKETRYRLTRYLSDPKDKQTLSSNEIYALLEDARGRIWIGTFDEGLNLATPGSNGFTFSRVGYFSAGDPLGGFRKIRCMAADQDGRIWLGTTNGLAVVDAGGAQYQVRSFRKRPGDINSLGNNDIQFVLRDTKNRMWLATSGGGLNLAVGDPFSPAFKFKVYTTKNGLPNDYLLSCTEDLNHHLWVATQSGISRFDPSAERFQNYNSYDGVPKVAFSEASCQLMKDGTLVFGTIKGFLSFAPQAIKDYPIYANMAFTNLQVNNADVSAASLGSVLESNINNAAEIQLTHRQNIFSIDYTVLDYRGGDKQTYLYRLKGFDNVWQNNQGQRRATFTNLPPGNYQFEVKCINKDLYLNIPSKTLAITILPPPWRTWWAYLIYAVISVFIIEMIRRTALTMLRLRQRIAVEHQLTELKVKFFTNISHELRTPLTLILNPLEEIAKKEQLSDQGNQYLQVIRRNAGRMARFINQLLDLRKVQSGKARLNFSIIDMVAFVKDIGTYFNELAREKNITLQVVSNQTVIYTWLDADKIETVLYNLISNAYKFTPEGKTITVTITAKEREDLLLIDVSDQGTGVRPTELQDIFELYYEGDPAKTEQLKGTGIGLALSRELIELHQGKIIAANNETGGLTVSVSLPLAKPVTSDSEVGLLENSPILADYPESEIVAEPVLSESSATHQKSAPLVLLVEDNPDMRIFLKTQLSVMYRVEVAENGEEGLSKARRILPDMVISDIMMPRMNGVEMLDKLKNDAATSHIPVVLLSAKSAIESQIEGIQYGADYYITKPFNNEFLFAAIANILDRRKRIAEGLINGQKIMELNPGEITITSKDETFLKRVLEIVEEKMADTNFNIDTVAGMVNMGRTAFYSKFKSLTQMAPVEFVREMRLKRARQYFDAGSENIAEVGYTVGFNNSKYFSTCFKAKYHLSPSDYLKVKHAGANQPS
ncbi:MAG: two-component regulator propeller domain-containing protein [Bacteroidota bacterium]